MFNVNRNPIRSKVGEKLKNKKQPQQVEHIKVENWILARRQNKKKNKRNDDKG